MVFAKLKAHLRARAVRTPDALWRAVGAICYHGDRCGYSSSPRLPHRTRFQRATSVTAKAKRIINGPERPRFKLERVHDRASDLVSLALIEVRHHREE